MTDNEHSDLGIISDAILGSVEKPVNENRKKVLRTRALAQLRQSVWEATQYLSLDETLEYVHAILREIESDEP